jgi:hypothetical protein
MPIAVLSDSTKIRGMVVAMSWFNREIRAFHPTALREALTHLGVPTSRAELIEHEKEKLRLSLDLT